MQKEIWVEIPHYEGYYQVSNFGRIKSTKREGAKGGFLKQSTSGRGYLFVHLSKKGIVETCFLHQIVATLFCGGYCKGLQVNHKDGNKKNNHFENLEWVTPKENTNHAIYVLGVRKKRKCK